MEVKIVNERIIKFTVRLTEREHKQLKEKATKCSLKMEPYVRKLIEGSEVKARPPNEYVTLIREVNAIGNNINQIAHKANAENHISQDEINEVKKYQSELIHLVKGMR